MPLIPLLKKLQIILADITAIAIATVYPQTFVDMSNSFADISK